MVIKLRPDYNEELSILGSNLNIQIDELSTYLEKEINKHLNIDPYKVLTKLISNSVYRNNRNGRDWLRTNLFILLNEKQSEVVKDNSVNIVPLYNAFREFNFTGDDVDKYLIEEIALSMIGQPFVKVEDVAKTFEAIVQFMIQSYQPHQITYENFINYIMRSKLVKEKCHIDVNTLRSKVEAELEEMKNVINNKTTKS